MHYIRFLRPPKIHVDQPHSRVLRTVLTITTDLGETFLPSALDLVATLRSPSSDSNDHEGDIYLRKTLHWPGDGARSLPVVFDLTHQDIDWPAVLHITVRVHLTTKPTNFLPPIVDIRSGPLNPTKGLLDSGWRVERRFTSLAERPVSLLEDAGDSIARHLWDGSLALAQHLDQTLSLQNPACPLPLLEHVLVSAAYHKLSVIELGCGCGGVGISLAQAIPGCDVLLTDLPDAEDLVQANISRMKPAISSLVRFEVLDWEQDVLPASLPARTNDLILVAECTYNVDTLRPLVATLVNLVARSPKAIIVVATKTRHESEAAFFDMMREVGFTEEGRVRLPLPGEMGSGYADAAADVGVHVFHGREHRLSLGTRKRSDESVATRMGRRPSRGNKSR